MVAPVRRRRSAQEMPGSASLKARVFLALACFWPLGLLVLLASSAPQAAENGAAASPHNAVRKNIATTFHDVLDRVDIVGFGPTHPRVAVVITGSDRGNLVTSTESVFATTDMNRIFMVVVVVDGRDEDKSLTKDLMKIDRGEIPHWHGNHADVHEPGQAQDSDEEKKHGQKVKVLYNPVARGVAESRKDATDFLRILEKSHIDEGLKSEHEDLILLLLQSGAQVTSQSWLKPVTDALIVPPPILGLNDHTVSLKLANAVAFNLEGHGKHTSFDSSFSPLVSNPTSAQINLSNGISYPSPALNGAAVAMRLDTYMDLPSQDLSLKDAWSANLDLALNLWLCGDGIDMLKDVEVTSFERTPPAPLGPDVAARFAATWMDDLMQKKFFNTYMKNDEELTYYEWQTYVATAQASPHFANAAKKCRTFEWYAQTVNDNLNDLLFASAEVERRTVVTKESRSAQDPGTHRTKPTQKVHILPRDPKQDETGGPDLANPPYVKAQRPTKPLCKECLEIISKAHPLDTTYVDVSGGHKEHPHLGAKDDKGALGYVHDETALHVHPDRFVMSQEALESACTKRDNNYKMLNEKVFVDLEYEKSMQGKTRDKIFCLVYTISPNHKTIPDIRQTWGSKCDGFMVASNATDTSLGTVNILHEGTEQYGNIWQKVRSMWSYVYDNYYEKYDYFHIGGDDLYLIVENLRYYLESEEIKAAGNGGMFLPDGTEKEQTPLFLGRRFAYQGNMDDIFNSGGSGYTLNKAALKLLVVEGFAKYFLHAKTFSEDTIVAKIFRQFGVFPYETKDENGGERYMPFMPGHHYGWRMPRDKTADWYAQYSINIKEGVDHCAARSVAFHYVKVANMKRLHALLYKLCPAEMQSQNAKVAGT